jgi:endonuclease/exonuclease/phosphatase family metal-dependent hydrolase
MKIATYNLRFGGKEDRRIHWDQIFQTISPDIFLVQETCEPNAYIADDGSDNWQEHVHWVPVPGIKKQWGSAIYAKSGRMTPIVMPSELQGAVVGVDLDDFAAADGKRRSLRVFSIHAPEPYKKSVNVILDCIAGLSKDRELIIGGDFNLTTGIRHPKEFESGDPWLIGRLRKEFNLMSCWQSANPNRDLPQTLRYVKDRTKPFHCDGIFVPAAWYGDLAQAEVLSAPIWDELSDHNPVFAKFS